MTVIDMKTTGQRLSLPPQLSVIKITSTVKTSLENPSNIIVSLEQYNPKESLNPAAGRTSVYLAATTSNRIYTYIRSWDESRGRRWNDRKTEKEKRAMEPATGYTATEKDSRGHDDDEERESRAEAGLKVRRTSASPIAMVES